MGFSITSQPFWDTPIYGNPHIILSKVICWSRRDILGARATSVGAAEAAPSVGASTAACTT